MKTILVIDDALDTRTFLADTFLKNEGYHVFAAANGAEARHHIQHQVIDLIISDYHLPDTTGLMLYQEFKAQHIPFILITAEGSESLAVECLRVGVNDYFKKPFDLDTFLERIQHHLNQSSNNSTHHILDNTPSLLVTKINPTGQLVYQNAAFQSIFQTTLNSYFNEDLHADLMELFRKNESGEIEVSEQTYYVQFFPQSDGSTISTLFDITHYKELDRAKSDFVTAISHDLRSPLTTIMGYVELLGRIGELNDQQKKFTDNILFSVRSITALLSDLMELNKLESDYNTAREPTQMDRIVRYAIETHRADMAVKNLTLASEIVEVSPIIGNPIRLKQMVSNLIQNAIKYTEHGGTITINMYEDDNLVILQVIDTGVGIPRDEQAKIWDKFYRANDMVDKVPGTGLGLSIVKTIIDSHEGRVWLDSAPGEGSNFTVMLPTIPQQNDTTS